eukprot:TRINITY_DN10794_c2_g1_i1.p1 TRINITY_DN10794_c2_g1~~TRINITY_DN10794_c2_g1_i1.p1  ORF type:complete len:594 (+),score=227.24 TRINITY_DN10794_c2_g1_i1:90-1784(+)
MPDDGRERRAEERAALMAEGERRVRAFYSRNLGCVGGAQGLEEMVSRMRTPLPLTVWVTPDGGAGERAAGLLRSGRATDLHTSGMCGVALQVPKDSPGPDALCTLHAGGAVTRQEAVSMLPPHALLAGSAPGPLRVLDACAAPGMKTCQIAAMLDRRADGSTVVANDCCPKRCNVLASNLARLRRARRTAAVVCHDAATLPSPAAFTHVLCDVPCSGDGTARKNIAAWAEWELPSALSISELQTRIAVRAAKLLRPGGRMVYSTCSLNPFENEAVVLRLLSSQPRLRVVPFPLPMPPGGIPGVTSWTDGSAEQHTAPEQLHSALRNCVRIVPGDGADCGGFFVAVLQMDAEEAGDGEAAAAAAVKVKRGRGFSPLAAVVGAEEAGRVAREWLLTREAAASLHCHDPHEPGAAPKTIFSVSAALAETLAAAGGRWHVVAAGCRAFRVSERRRVCGWRACEEAVDWLSGNCGRVIECGTSLRQLLHVCGSAAPVVALADCPPAIADPLRSAGPGTYLLRGVISADDPVTEEVLSVDSDGTSMSVYVSRPRGKLLRLLCGAPARDSS